MSSTSPREARKTGTSLGFAVVRFQRARKRKLPIWETDNLEIRRCGLLFPSYGTITLRLNLTAWDNPTAKIRVKFGDEFRSTK